MSNQDVMNVLKSLTLEDIIKLVINDEKKNGVNEDKQEIIESSKEIYNIEELIEKYPFFTRYNINKAIDKKVFLKLIIRKTNLRFDYGKSRRKIYI